MCSYHSYFHMVFLKDLKTQWPWNADAEVGDDKIIYVEEVAKEDASIKWRIPIEPPKHGYAYVGFRVVVDDAPVNYAMRANLVYGHTVKPLFEEPFEGMTCKNSAWTAFVFPLTHRMIAIDDEGLDIRLNHMTQRSGYIEMLAQRFDDLLEDESSMNYAFINETSRPVRLMTPKGQFYSPAFEQLGLWEQPVKIVPPMRRILDTTKPDWFDDKIAWPTLSMTAPVN